MAAPMVPYTREYDEPGAFGDAETGHAESRVFLAKATDIGPTIKRVMDGDAPPPASLDIDRLALTADINLVGGNGGTGKSTVLDHVGVCYVTGRHVFGTLEVRRPGPVIFAVPEDGEAQLRMVIEAFAEGMELTDVERAALAADLYVVGDERPLILPRDIIALGQLCRDVSAVALMLDPLPSLLGAASDSDGDVAAVVCDHLRRHVCRAANTTVHLSHHFRKPGKEVTANAPLSAADMRGSGGWVNHSRLVFGLTKTKGDSRITFDCLKSNRVRGDIRHEVDLSIDANPTNEAHWAACRLIDVNIGAEADSGATSESLTAGMGRAVNANERAMLEALHHPYEPGRRTSWSALKTALPKMNPNTAKTTKERLIGAGLLEAKPIGKGNNGRTNYDYAVTERGRNLGGHLKTGH